MTPLNAFARLRHRLQIRRIDALTGGLWWCVVVLCVSSVHNYDVLVRAQFASNPLVLNPTTDVLVLNGVSMSDQSGYSVSGVGDVNGDSVDDFVVGAWAADPFGMTDAGQVFLLFGRNAGNPWVPNPFELSTLDGTNGVTLNGLAMDDRVGFRVSGVKDVNGDDVNDFIIGTETGDVAYVLFGVNGTWPAAANLTQGAFNGFTIVGEAGDDTGYSVGDAGDVNNDGMHDIAIGTRNADTPGGNSAGRMDVLYGRPLGSPWPVVVDLTTHVNTSTGFSVLGDNLIDFCGSYVSGVGDVNGDDVDDVAVGCPGGDPHGAFSAGIVAVVFGSASGLPVAITPSQLNGTNGFVVNGHRGSDEMGHALAAVGDVNADTLNDFVIGAHQADANGFTNSGEMYVWFGRNASQTWPAEVNVTSLDGNNGFTLAGGQFFNLGRSLSAAGDVNNDGINDVLVSADGADFSRGRALLLYGRAVWPAVQNSTDLEDNNSQTFEGSTNSDLCAFGVSRVGDVNGDGRGDFAIGCPGAEVDGRTFAGQTAIVFGPLFTDAPTAAPTEAPTTPSPTTVSPTTAPTTLSPTTGSPTVSPTTLSPTTLSPTAFPTTASPATASPTTSPTTAPPTSTSSPTISQAPTTSPTPGSSDDDDDGFFTTAVIAAIAGGAAAVIIGVIVTIVIVRHRSGGGGGAYPMSDF